MADRIIKGDSGNDVVIQNNAGSRKIEVTNSGDVEVTGDVKTTTIKATNLKANDGTAGLVVADSTGEVTSSGGLKADNIKTTNLKANDGTASLEIADSTGDIGFSGNTNLKFKLPSSGGIYESDGSTEILTESGGVVTLKNTSIDQTSLANGQLVKSTFIKIQSGSVPSTTTTFASTFDYQQVTCTVGNTIVFDFSFGGEVEINSGSSAQRQGNFKIFQSTSSVSSGATSSLGTQLNLQTSGRTLTGASSSGAATFYSFTLRSIFVATATSHYFGMAHASPDTTAVRVTVFATSDRPATISVYEFKGDVLT